MYALILQDESNRKKKTRPGPDESAGTAKPFDQEATDVLDLSGDDLLKQVRELGPPKLIRRSNSGQKLRHVQWIVEVPSISLSAIRQPRQEDEVEALTHLLVGTLRNAILSRGNPGEYLNHRISLEVCTDSFVWNAKDFIKQYQAIEKERGSPPSIKLCLAFQKDPNNRGPDGKLLARLMEPSIPAVGGNIERPGSKSLNGTRSLHLLIFPKSSGLGLQSILEDVMQRTHFALRECFPCCHLIPLQQFSVLWNPTSAFKAGVELPIALERAKYLRENRLLQSQKNLAKLLTEEIKKRLESEEQVQDEYSCTDTDDISQDFTVCSVNNKASEAEQVSLVPKEIVDYRTEEIEDSYITFHVQRRRNRLAQVLLSVFCRTLSLFAFPRLALRNLFKRRRKQTK